MDQAANTPIPPAAGPERVSPRTMPDRQISPLAGHRQRQGRNGEPPLAVPEPRALVLERLRRKIRAIEGHAPARPPAPVRTGEAALAHRPAAPVGEPRATPAGCPAAVTVGCRPAASIGSPPATTVGLPPTPDPSPHGRGEASRRVAAWTLGADEIDARLGPAGLDVGGVHELKPGLVMAGEEAPGDFAADGAAAVAFALRLVLRRRAMQGAALRRAPVLWCASARSGAELGRPYGPGLAALGLDPAAFLIVETAREQEALWAIEEGLRSSAVALVVGSLEQLSLTAARRLSLAAAAHGVPCLLLTHPRAPPAAATASRWRIARAASAPHPFDVRAPGAARWRIVLERSRNGLAMPEGGSMLVEWCDETHRLRMAAGVRDRARAARRA